MRNIKARHGAVRKLSIHWGSPRRQTTARRGCASHRRKGAPNESRRGSGRAGAGRVLINASLLCCEPSRNCFAYRDHRCFVQTIEITNPIEARRSRYALYRGEKASLMLNGFPVTGMVRSVREDRSSIPMRWIVSVVPDRGIAAASLSA
jgi:hypothetical protein